MARNGLPQISRIGLAPAIVVLAVGVACAAWLPLLAAAAPATAAPATAGIASLTIRARTCPPRYVAHAYAVDCDKAFGFGVEYSARSASHTATAETDQAGNARFEALPVGRYTVEEMAIPFDFIDELVVACAPSAMPDAPVPFTVTERGVRLNLASGADVTCDFFYLGSDARGLPTATVTIHNRLCPVGFAGPNYYAVCHGTPAPAGLEFVVDGPDQATASTDEAGNTAFRVAAGRYTILGGVPGDFATTNVFCAPAAQPGSRFPSTSIGGGTRGADDQIGVGLDLAAGDDVLCDWFNTPESGR